VVLIWEENPSVSFADISPKGEKKLYYIVLLHYNSRIFSPLGGIQGGVYHRAAISVGTTKGGIYLGGEPLCRFAASPPRGRKNGVI
jgi:hypothetical protein